MLQAKQKAVQDTANRLLKANNTVTCLEIKVDLWNNSKESIGGVPYKDLYWDEQMISDYMNQNCQSWGLCFVDDPNPVPHRVYSLVGQPVNHPVVASPTAQTNPRTGQPYKRGPYNKTAARRAVIVSTPTVPTRIPGGPKKAAVSTPTPSGVSKKVVGNIYISRSKALDLMQHNSGKFYTAIFIKKSKNGQLGESRTMNCQYLSTDALGYVKVKTRIKDPKTKVVTTGIRNVNLQTLEHLYIAKTHYKIR